jgi:hypothetical protein
VFAGAAREAVFSRPEVIRRVKAHFVPVALKAALVNNPPDGAEGRLYREIGRSKIAPQGICVVNSTGKVLNWVVMFDGDKSVLAFLDHARKRFARFPDAAKPVPAQRHMKFPSARLPDVKDNGKALRILPRHPRGQSCPGKPLLARGTVLARVFGRALGKDGKPVADTIRQEHYVEDRFHVPVDMQQALAKGRAAAGGKRFRLAGDLARLLVSHAYLGQLDVNPVGAPGGKGTLQECKFWARQVSAGRKGPLRLRIEGRSQAAGASGDGDGGDGRLWQHEVKLTWQGVIEMRKDRITRMLLVARGAEKLEWGPRSRAFRDLADVARLPAGHAIDLTCPVRYGILGEPLAAEETTDSPDVPDKVRRQLVEAFGPTFLVFRTGVQEEIGLGDAQRKKVRQRLAQTLPDAMRFFGKLGEMKPEEREKELDSYRRKAQEKLSAFLKKTLKAKQLERLGQIELQHQGPFALARPDVARELKLTDEQRKRFEKVIRAMEKQILPLIKKAQSGGRPEEIYPKIMMIRKDHETKIEAILSRAQKRKWKEMLGKPFEGGRSNAG